MTFAPRRARHEKKSTTVLRAALGGDGRRGSHKRRPYCSKGLCAWPWALMGSGLDGSAGRFALYFMLRARPCRRVTGALREIRVCVGGIKNRGQSGVPPRRSGRVDPGLSQSLRLRTGRRSQTGKGDDNTVSPRLAASLGVVRAARPPLGVPSASETRIAAPYIVCILHVTRAQPSPRPPAPH